MEFVHSRKPTISEECQYYIDKFKDKSQVEDINDRHRKYHRVQFKDAELANTLYQKVKGYLPKKLAK